MSKIAYVEVIAPYETKFDKVRKIGNVENILIDKNNAQLITIVFSDKSAETFFGYAYHIVYTSLE